jgi:tetratricopeptide (TPR) repeat protein
MTRHPRPYRSTVASACVAMCIALALAPAGRVRAQDLAEARSLFEAGLAAARAERWELAVESFERSLRIAERPSTLLNLAGAESQTGRFTRAAASYRRYLELADREDPNRRLAREALAEVEASLAHIELAITGLSDREAVHLDGAPIERTALARPIAVDPGAHQVSIVRGATILLDTTVELRSGETRTVRARVGADAVTEQSVSVAGASPGAEEHRSAEARSHHRDDTTIWVGLGIGIVVLLGVGLGVGLAVNGTLGEDMIRF